MVLAVPVHSGGHCGLLTARASAARKRPADLSTRALQSGLHDRLGAQSDPWSGVPTSVELALSESLREEVRRLALCRNLTDSRFKTALRLFEDASLALPHRIWFLPLGGADELRNAVHNEESFGMLAEFKMRQGCIAPAGSFGGASARRYGGRLYISSTGGARSRSGLSHRALAGGAGGEARAAFL